MNKNYLRFGLPIGAAAVIAGVLAGIFVPGADEQQAAPDAVAPSEATSAASQDTAASNAAGDKAADGAPSGTDAASTPATGPATDPATSTGSTGTEASAGASGQASPSETTRASAGTADAATSATTETGSTASSNATVSERAKPSFDVVRVNPKGGTVMAGRAEPGAEVVILDSERELGRATANERGEWVYTRDAPIEAGDRQLSLKDATPGGAESEQVVVLSVPETKPGEESSALAVMQPREGGATVVLQLPEETKPLPSDVPIASVDSVDYGSEGEVTISGRANPGAQLNIYLDNAIAGTAKADDEGRWSFAPGDKLTEAPQQLRVDSVDQGAKVIARAETPIARSPAAKLAVIGETLVIVQPGNSLWRIARRTYGGGVHYSEIFQANRDQIRNPDLIYPGQIFTVPSRG